jgi:formiminotetrahydrofolate cyclodeaminase
VTFGEQTINRFLAELGSSASVPGGGAASAVTGAIAAGLVAMVAELSVGRSRYAPFEATIEHGRSEGHRLEATMIELADADAAAFAGYMAAAGLPRTTPAETAARSAALAKAAHAAIEPPRSILLACVEVAQAAERLAGRSNLGLASDLVVASRLAEGAAHGAVANVLVNLPSLGDEKAAAALAAESDELTKKVTRLARATRAQVARKSLRAPEGER